MSRGVRIGGELLEFVPAKSKIRPLRDHVVVEPLPAEPTIILDTVWKPIRGKVLAAGKGHYPLEYRNTKTGEWSRSTPKGQRDMSRPSKVFQPCDVRVGDIVELGGRELGGYLHCTVRWGRKEVLVIREADVALILEE